MHLPRPAILHGCSRPGVKRFVLSGASVLHGPPGNHFARYSAGRLLLSDSSNTVAGVDDYSYDPFSIFNSPTSQGVDTSSTSSSADSTTGNMFGSDWGSEDDPMQQLYSSMTWSTYYPSTTDTGDQGVMQESGPLQDSTAADGLEMAAVRLDTPEGQAMYDSTITSMQATDSSSEAASAPGLTSQDVTETGAVALDKQQADDSLHSAEPNLGGTGETDVMQASTDGYDASASQSAATTNAADKSIEGAAADIGTDSGSMGMPQPVTTSAEDITNAAGASASAGFSSGNDSPGLVLSDESGIVLTLEMSAAQQEVAHSIDSDNTTAYQFHSAVGTPREHVGATTPRSLVTSTSTASIERPTDNALDPYSSQHDWAGSGGAHIGPGLITGVGVSLAGAFLAALGVMIWYKNRPFSTRQAELRKLTRGLKKSWGVPETKIMPIVVATAGNVHDSANSPAGSCDGVSDAATQTVYVGTAPESAPTAGVDLKWFSCSSSFDYH